LTEERDNWDNLSHGSTYRNSDIVAKEKEEKRKKEEEEEEEKEKKKKADEEEQSKKDLGPDEKGTGKENDGDHNTKKDVKKSLKDVPKNDKRESSSKNTKLVKRGDTDDEWSDVEKEAYQSFEKCGAACQANNQCFQYVYFDETCKLGLSFRLGAYKAPNKEVSYKSGWMLPRIREWQEANVCEEPEWEG